MITSNTLWGRAGRAGLAPAEADREATRWPVPSYVSAALLAVVLSACSGIDRDSAKALGGAGQKASQAMADQTALTAKTTGYLSEWWAVRDALICINVQPGLRASCLNIATKTSDAPDVRLTAAQKQIVDIMRKRSDAAVALRNAYQAFINLAAYDAAAETEAAIQGAFGAINDLTSAAAVLSPGLAALAPISSTFTTIASSAGGIIMAERQRHLLRAASRDLHRATDAMIAALTVELDQAAATGLLAMLVAERVDVYGGLVQAGIITPADALTPLVTEIAPGAKPSPQANSDIARAAAVASIKQRARLEEAAVKSTYEATLAAFKALSAEHARLEDDKSIDVSVILAQSQRIEAIAKAVFKKQEKGVTQ